LASAYLPSPQRFIPKGRDCWYHSG